MFKFLKKPKEKILTPAAGDLIPIADVKDDVFSQKMMGDGFAIKPQNSDVFAPVSGKISTVFPTKHAIGITTKQNIEVLVHLGIDTVELNGRPFQTFANQDQEVKAGDKIPSMDLKQIYTSGKDNSIIVVFTNMDLIDEFPMIVAKAVKKGELIGEVTIKK